MKNVLIKEAYLRRPILTLISGAVVFFASIAAILFCGYGIQKLLSNEILLLIHYAGIAACMAGMALSIGVPYGIWRAFLNDFASGRYYDC